MGIQEFDQPVKPPAPVKKEDSAVKAAGQRVIDEQAKKKGRSSTQLSSSSTGFTGILNKKTGSAS